jgi:PBP1b-binding outer membrane lipoprotein LpoB
MRRIAMIAGLALLASGCVVDRIAEHRVRSALLNAGLSERNADCMAHRMVDRLSIGQLRKLEQLEGEKRSIADYVAAVRRVGDAEAVAVTASSAALCATGIAR